MTRTGLLHFAWFVVLLAAVGFVGYQTSSGQALSPGPAHPSEAAPVDATGRRFTPRDYRRVASGSSLGDALLLALAEPERIVGLSAYGHDHADAPHLYGERELLAGMNTIERLLTLRIDLLIVNSIGSQSELARARAAGLEVFNLGDMRGLVTLVPNIHAVASLLGDPERGRVFADQLVRRMRAVAADIPPAQRREAAYVSCHGGKLFGGGRGTSYHDVLSHAGLIDVAAREYEGWPQYDPEQLLALDPEHIVTATGLGAGLCAVSGLSRLRACQGQRRGVIELPEDLLGDPGPRMLEAAEQLRARVYGPPPDPEGTP